MDGALYLVVPCLISDVLVAAKRELGEMYRREEDLRVRERLLLVLRVEGDGVIPARAAKELHRSRPWVSYWLERYREEGANGLRDRPRSGRPSRLPPEVELKIRKELSRGEHGWTTRQVHAMIVRESGMEYHFTHIYRLLHRWGFRLKVPRKRHVNTASREEKEGFKKSAGSF